MNQTTQDIRMNIYLIGYKCSGKTTLGRELATKLGRNYIDLDDVMEANFQLSIPNLYISMGELQFRRLERKTFLDLKHDNNYVLATGGGFPCWFNNINILLKKGIVIYLKASEEILYQRMKHVSKLRPILNGYNGESLRKYITKLRKKNDRKYNQAHITFDSENDTFYELIDKLEKLNYKNNG